MEGEGLRCSYESLVSKNSRCAYRSAKRVLEQDLSQLAGQAEQFPQISIEQSIVTNPVTFAMRFHPYRYVSTCESDWESSRRQSHHRKLAQDIGIEAGQSIDIERRFAVDVDGSCF